MEGVEPTCLTAPDPKSGASASFATSAMKFQGTGLKVQALIPGSCVLVLVNFSNKGRKNRDFKSMRQMMYQVNDGFCFSFIMLPAFVLLLNFRCVTPFNVQNFIEQSRF
jgi:hypothetical protein